MPNSSKVNIGLESIGLQSNQHLKNSLINCDDPLKAISDFQEENSIQLQTLKPALNLLDLHNTKRLDFHLSIADELKEQLVKRVEELSATVNSKETLNASKDQITAEDDLKKLESLLEKTFPLINMPRLTSLVLLIMKSLPKINPKYLNYINENESLYNMSPIEVKRQIWCLNQEVFKKELEPIFDKFLNAIDEITANFELSISSATTGAQTNINIESSLVRENLLLNSTAYSSILKSNKRLGTYISELIKLIGNSSKLYQFTINTLSSLYLKTNNWFYSTLRGQLIFKLNEHHHNDFMHLISASNNDAHSENVFKFASIINSCLKEKRIDTKRAKELEIIMESKKFEKIIPDVAFILADPFVFDMLARNAMSFINKCVQNELLPRNCPELIFVLRLLSLSLFSWEIINSQSFKEPIIDGVLITEYLPNIAYFITDYYEKLYDDSLDTLLKPAATSAAPSLLTTSPNFLSTPQSTTNVTSTLKSSPPIVLKISTRKYEIVSSIKQQIIENKLCSILFLYLIIAGIELNDWQNLKVLLPTVRYPESNEILFEKWFLHFFLNAICEKSIIENFKHDWFVTLVFDEFLFVQLQQKDSQLTSATTAGLQATKTTTNSVNTFYDQIYKLIDKLYPAFIPISSLNHLIELFKPKKSHSSSTHIMYLKLKAKVDTNSSDLND